MHQRTRRSAVALTGAAVLATGAAHGASTPPAPCYGTPQITDATGDGHHPNEDITAAWFSEAGGRLQGVIQTQVGAFAPAHDDSAAADFALLFGAGDAVRYVRASAAPGGAIAYDHGTFTAAGGFASAGPTAGAVTGNAVVIDIPDAPADLRDPFALTADGTEGDRPHWVDRAPGGVSPDETSFGADYRAGSCAGIPAAPGPGGEAPAPATGTAAVLLRADRERVTGGGEVGVRGAIKPARADVPVELTVTGRRSATIQTTTDGAGGFSFTVPVGETSRLRARADGVGSQELAVTVRSTVTFRARRGGVVTGRVRPRLPGRVLLVHAASGDTAGTARPRAGRFRLRLSNPSPGRYQAVFVPAGARAERSTSNTGALR